jgi:hypothetical protein
LATELQFTSFVIVALWVWGRDCDEQYIGHCIYNLVAKREEVGAVHTCLRWTYSSGSEFNCIQIFRLSIIYTWSQIPVQSPTVWVIHYSGHMTDCTWPIGNKIHSLVKLRSTPQNYWSQSDVHTTSGERLSGT